MQRRHFSLIEVTNLTKNYGSRTAVNNLSFKVEKGQVYGFLGPNGAGKSTTMNIIAGTLAPTSGKVTVGGYDILDEPYKAKRLIGYLPELPPVYPDMTVKEYLSFVGRAKGLKGEELKNEISRVCEITDITDMTNRLIKTMSKGYRQRVGIAQAVMGNPEVVILDEPTVGLDPRQIIEIRELIEKLGEEHTVILSSHIMQEISAVCSMIMIINKGELVVCDTPENLKKAYSGSTVIEIKVKDEFDLAILDGVEGEKEFNDNTLTVTTEKENAMTDIIKLLSANGVDILGMNQKQTTLEDIFLEVTEEGDEK